MRPAAPRQVVRKALRSIGRKPRLIPGGMNRVSDFMGKYFTPRRMQTVMLGKLLGRAVSNGQPVR